MDKPNILIIDDNRNWLSLLSDSIASYIPATIESFESFALAEARLFDNKAPFDLLITDVYPTDVSREPIGLKFADFVNTFLPTPIIVVSAEPKAVFAALQQYRVVAAFDKASFGKLEFVKAVKAAIGTKLPSTAEHDHQRGQGNDAQTPFNIG